MAGRALTPPVSRGTPRPTPGHLADCAVEHDDYAEPTVSVTVSVDDAVTVRVADDGPGVPEPTRRRLGERTSLDVDHLDGLGLWIAYWITVRSGGRLTIEDNDPRGTVVVIRLPRPPRHA